MLRKIESRRRRGWQRMRWLDGHGFGWTPGVGDGQGGLACCDSWGCKELDMTEQLNLTELNWRLSIFLLSNLGLIIAQQTSIHINCFMAGGWHTSCHPISKIHIVGEGPGDTPSALRYPSYLINGFLTDIKLLLKLAAGVGVGATLHPLSDVYVRSILCPLSYFNKTLLHKSSWVVKPSPQSQS